MVTPMKQAALPILVLLVIVTLAVVAALPSASVEADHYERYRDGKSLYTLLRGSIEDGDSLEDVEDVIGSGEPLVDDMAEEVRKQAREDSRWSPDSYPHGVLNSDNFVSWPVDNQTVTLQFRNGYLINHDQSDFTDYFPDYDVAGQAAETEGDPGEGVVTVAGRKLSPERVGPSSAE